MSGIDKILEDIRAEAQQQADEILSVAGAKADAIRAQAGKDASEAAGKIRADYAHRIAEAAARAESAGELRRRQSILAARQSLIAETMDTVLSRAKALPEREYFDALLTLAGREAQEGDGVLCFNAADLERMPVDFASRLEAVLPPGSRLTVSDEAADIPDGFVLKYDGVEQNCTFEAVLAADKEELQDRIRQILFA